MCANQQPQALYGPNGVNYAVRQPQGCAQCRATAEALQRIEARAATPQASRSRGPSMVEQIIMSLAGLGLMWIGLTVYDWVIGQPAAIGVEHDVSDVADGGGAGGAGGAQP